MIKDPKMPFFLKKVCVWGVCWDLPASLGCIFAPETADHGSFLSHFPLGPRPWGKGRKCMFGNWYHWNAYCNVHDHQHPSFPQGEVEGAVGVDPPPWQHPWRSQTTMASQAKRADGFLGFNWGRVGLGRFSITVSFFCQGWDIPSF